MQAAKLTWGEGVVEFNQQYGPFDIIIGSGCVYASIAPASLSLCVCGVTCVVRPPDRMGACQV
jgi:hypothetical protein